MAAAGLVLPTAETTAQLTGLRPEGWTTTSNSLPRGSSMDHQPTQSVDKGEGLRRSDLFPVDFDCARQSRATSIAASPNGPKTHRVWKPPPPPLTFRQQQIDLRSFIPQDLQCSTSATWPSFFICSAAGLLSRLPASPTTTGWLADPLDVQAPCAGWFGRSLAKRFSRDVGRGFPASRSLRPVSMCGGPGFHNEFQLL